MKRSPQGGADSIQSSQLVSAQTDDIPLSESETIEAPDQPEPELETVVDSLTEPDPVQVPLEQAEAVKEQEAIDNLASERTVVKEDEPSVPVVVEKQVKPEPVVKPEQPKSSSEPAYVLVKLVVSFKEDCWVQVKSMNNKVLYTDVQKAGSTLDLEVPEKVIVRFGNVAGVSSLNFAGRDRAVDSRSGRKVVSLVLDTSDAG